MKNPLGICLAIVAMLFLATIAVCVFNVTKHLDATLDATRDTVAAIKLPTQKLAATWAATGLTAAQTFAKERDAFSAQQKQYSDVGRATVKTLDAATETVKGVNDSQRRIADAAISSSEAITKSVLATSDRTSESVQTLTSGSVRLLDAATAQVSNPQIAETVGHLDSVSGSAADTAKHLDTVSLTAEEIIEDFKQYIHDTLHPTKLKQFLQALEQSIFLGLKIAY